MKDFWIWLLTAALAGFLAAYLMLQPKNERPTPQLPTETTPAPARAAPKATLLDEPSKGAEEASVTIIEFADFKCHFCQQHFQQTLPLIDEEYIAAGKARYVYRNFPILGVQSRWAAEASECAHEQGSFWQYHDKLFNLGLAGQGNFVRSQLKTISSDLGLDSAAFDACLDSHKYIGEVQEDLEAGRVEGVTGTPAFLINGDLLVGAQPIEVFRQKIDQALEKVQKQP